MKNKLKYILITIIFILIFVDFFLYLYKSNKRIVTDFNGVISAKEKKEIDDPVLVRYDNLMFYIPFKYKFKINNDILYVSYKDKWSMNLQVIKLKYNDILYDRKTIKKNYEKNDYEVDKIEEEIYEGRNYLIFKFKDEKYNHLMLYTKLSKRYTYVIEFVSNLDNDEVLEIVNPLIETVESE